MKQNNQMVSTRDTYGESLLKFGEENFIVLDADLSLSTQTYKFAKKYPKRFINIGCAEQNLVGVAAGLSIADKDRIVFVSTYSMFLMRAWEQIRNTIGHDNLNIKFCVTHSGLTNSTDGSSHQCLEDFALMASIPNLVVLNPCDSIETEKLIESEINRKGPAYIRLNREKTPIITEEYYKSNKFELGKAIKLREGKDIGIISSGTMTSIAMTACDLLEKERIRPEVYNIPSIKPIDKQSIIDTAKKTGKIITIEEHSIFGGLGSMISEILSENYHTHMKIIGIKDTYGESGTYNELLEKFGLNIDNVVKSARYMLDKTKRF